MAGLALALPALAGGPVRLGPPLSKDRDDREIAMPREQQVSEMYAILNNSWLRHLSPENKALAARDRGALNVNAWDEVPESSWFTNRMGRRSMTFGEILTGLEGTPPRSGVWSVVGNVDEGYTPKLRITDSAGNGYQLKFDLPQAPERNSAAERISTLLLYAAGYNVPYNTIIHFRAEDLRLGEKARYTDAVGRRRPMTAEDLAAALGKLKPRADGRYRGIASSLLADYLGKFKYDGTRRDDPNDIIPHELRRELRGFRVIASWINHADTGDKNTAEAFVRTNGERGHVKHYLLDFGSTLGSGDYTNGPFRVGHEYLFDGGAMGRTLFSLGAWRRPWEAKGKIRHAEVGYFEAELFDPEKWRPNYPNLAFVRMDDGDAYWGARIVTAFTDETIGKLVAAGEYSRPEVAQYVTDTLKRRRDIIGRFWLDKVSPLEEFMLAGDRLRFRDLSVERGYAEAGARKYQSWTEDLQGRRRSAPKACSGDGCEVATANLGNSPKDRFGRTLLGRVLIQSSRRGGGWAAPVEVVLGREADGGEIKVLGWRHGPR